MKFSIKSVARTAIASVALASVAISASATTVYSSTVNGASFSNLSVGYITVGSLSDVAGNLFAAQSVTLFPGYSLTLDSVTFTSATVGSLTPDNDPSTDGFSFQNVVAGTYQITASGSLSGNGQVSNLAIIGANYTVTAVPEPKTSIMLLAGLGLIGSIALRRRNKSGAP